MGRLRSPRPDAPPRQRWFVDPETWTRERVIDRCREWAEQTGAPPSYYQWEPMIRGEAVGRPARLAAKWEREHPYWPSVMVVYRLLSGGWREMLTAAGFPARPVLELPFAERVSTARRLRAQGLRWREIADQIGVAPDTVRRYTRAHDCSGCGAPILSVTAAQCRGCASRERTRWGEAFSDEEIMRAIDAWRRLERRAPTRSDWRPVELGGHPRWERECPFWPPTSHVLKRFGSWNAALRAAGSDRPRPKPVTDAQIIEALRAYHREHGVSPRDADWRARGLRPNNVTISSRFGSWNGALYAAGLPARTIRVDWRDEDILVALKRYARDHGRPPRAADRVGLSGLYPSPALVITRFGSWSTALRAAWLEPGNPPPVTHEVIARALREYHDNHGQSPSTTAWKADRSRPSAEAIIRHCGSWARALELAGLPVPARRQRGPDSAEIFTLLRAYQREHGQAPSAAAWKRAGLTPSVKVIGRRFGSWQQALNAAAFSPSNGRPSS